MKENDIVLKIPYGTKDFLPREAKRKRIMEGAVADLFARWGYDEVVTPTFEYAQTIITGAGSELLQNMFRFFDKDNQILVLRPDMTTPIARVAATRLREQSLPLKLFYVTNVFRYEQAQAGRQCEFCQAGVELLGEAGASADAEVVALAVETMLEAGLTNFQISLGQVQYINGIMQQSGLDEEKRQAIKTCMMKKDLVGLEEIIRANEMDPNVAEMLRNTPRFYGGDDMFFKAYQLVGNETSRKALDNLAEIYTLLKSYGLEQYVNFDLGLIRDLNYYTGMVFEGYTPGLGFPVCGGGRYDRMAAAFGVECPATGFALGMERILLALDRQGVLSSVEDKDIYVGWNAQSQTQAIAEANRLRKSGQTVEVALTAQTRQEAAENQQRKDYKRLVYFGD